MLIMKKGEKIVIKLNEFDGEDEAYASFICIEHLKFNKVVLEVNKENELAKYFSSKEFLDEVDFDLELELI